MKQSNEIQASKPRVKKATCDHLLLVLIYSSFGELDIFETLFVIFFAKRTVGTVPRHRLNQCYMHRPYRIERLLKYGQETEQLIFKFETARKVGSSGLVR